MKNTFTDEQIYEFAVFIQDYLDNNINEVAIIERHDIDCEHLNFREAIDTWLNKKEKSEMLPLWGDELSKFFSSDLNDTGWLTSEWAYLIEERLQEPKRGEMYNRMYLLEFEESEDGKLVRPKND